MFRMAGVHVLGGPCPGRGPEPRIGCTGSAHLGTDLPVHLSQVEPDRSAVLLLGGLVIWAALAIPTPPLQASYYTPTTVVRARLWIVALTLTGAVVGFLVRRLGHVGPSSSPDRP